MNITIIFEDDDILIIDKPAGVTVNKAETTKNELTVQEWSEQKLNLEPRTKNLKQEGNNEKWDPVVDFYNRGGIVHRIDKETSGILILAKTPEAFIELQRQFKERIVDKKYVALAHGKILPDEGEINVPVGRLPWNRMHFGVVPGGRESVTRYKTISNFQSNHISKDKSNNSNEIMSYLELSPKTGRTHQIRVHLKYLGHPIFGDYLYAGRKTAKKDRKLLSRVFLHAAKISFLHPKSGKRVEFVSKLPSELENVLSRLIRV